MLGLACLTVLLLLSLLQQPTAVAARADLPSQAVKPTFIAIGDGLTEGAFNHKYDGWGLLMQERYVRKADVVNRGFGGYFTSWFVDYMLDELYDVANPTFAILCLGTKDTLTKAVSGHHYISPEQFADNVEKIIRRGREAGVKHFLIVTPPPVCVSCKKNTPKPWDREPEHSMLYVEKLKALAAKYKAGLLNIFEEWQKDPKWADTLLQPDKLHLSSAGNKLLWKQMEAAIAAQVPAVAWQNVPLHYPLMDAIDKDDPGAAFDKVQHNSVKVAIKADSSTAAAAAALNGHNTVIAASDSSSSSSSSSTGSGMPTAEPRAQRSPATKPSLTAAWLLLGAALTARQLLLL